MRTNILTLLLFGIAVAVLAILAIKGGRKRQNAQKALQPSAGPQRTCSPIYLLRLMEVKRRAESRGDAATVEACINMTYNGPLPIINPNHTFVSEDAYVLQYSIAGINYAKGIRNYIGNGMGYIEAEPTNKYDPNAIAVHASDGHRLGYIPKDNTADVRHFTSSVSPYTAWYDIEEDFDYDENRRYFHGTVYLEIPNTSPNVSPANS